MRFSDVQLVGVSAAESTQAARSSPVVWRSFCGAPIGQLTIEFGATFLDVNKGRSRDGFTRLARGLSFFLKIPVAYCLFVHREARVQITLVRFEPSMLVQWNALEMLCQSMQEMNYTVTRGETSQLRQVPLQLAALALQGVVIVLSKPATCS